MLRMKLFRIEVGGKCIKTVAAESVNIKEVTNPDISVLMKCYLILDKIVKDRYSDYGCVEWENTNTGYKLFFMYDCEEKRPPYSHYHSECYVSIKEGNIHIIHDGGNDVEREVYIPLADPDCFGKYEKLITGIVKEVYQGD